MKQLFSLSFLLLASCAVNVCEDTNTKTSQGICIETGTTQLTLDEINSTIDLTENMVINKFNSTHETLAKVYDTMGIHFIDKLPGDSDSGTLGLTYQYGRYSYNVYILQDKCRYVGAAILSHEMLHVYWGVINGDFQGEEDSVEGHSKYWFVSRSYSVAENTDSIEYDISIALYNQYDCKDNS
jgi:hypothetical protein